MRQTLGHSGADQELDCAAMEEQARDGVKEKQEEGRVVGKDDGDGIVEEQAGFEVERAEVEDL